MIRIRKIVENGKIDGENTHGSTPDGKGRHDPRDVGK